MGVGWRAVHLDEVEAVAWQGTELEWRPLRSALGTRVAGMSAYTASRAGQVIVEPHAEDQGGRGHEEVYVVLRGRASFTLDGSTLDAPAGTFLRVSQEVVRSAVSAAPGTAVLALGGPATFEPSGSEWLERARPLMRTDPPRARALLDDLRAQLPSSPAVGIGEALLAASQGDEQRALRELGTVLSAHPELREALRVDPDLGPLLH